MLKTRRTLPVRRLLEVLLATAFMVCVLAAGFDFYYDLNDDTTIKDILSGSYTGSPSGYSVQMLYPLGALIAMCYRAIPGVAWYGLFLCLCQFGVFALVAFRLTAIFQTRKARFLSLLLVTVLYAGLLLRELVMVQYSVTSGICMAGAVFLYVTGETGESMAATMKKNAVPILLVVLSFMIRTELCLMLMPFLLLAGCSRLLAEWGKGKVRRWDMVRRDCMVALIALLGMLAVYGINLLATIQSPFGPNWQRFGAFFDARTKLYDFYEIPDYEENREFYREIGLSEASYALLNNYNFALDDSIDEHLLEEIVSYVEKNAQTNGMSAYFDCLYTKNSLREGVWLYRQRILKMQDGIWGILLLYLYATALLLYGRFTQKDKLLQIGKVVLLFLLRSGLWIYLLMVDRTPDRITVPLLLAETTLLVSWILEIFRKKRVNYAYLYLCLLLFGVCALYCNGKGALEEYRKREEINPRWEAFMTYCDYFPEDYFVMDVYSSTSHEGIAYSEKMFKNVDNSFKNYDICGGWLVKSPLYKEKLNRFGITDLESALCRHQSGKGQVYFAAATGKDLGWLDAYYAHKGQKIQITCVDEIWYRNEAVFQVYSIETVEE